MFVALTGVALFLEDGLKLQSCRNLSMLVGIPGAMLQRMLGLPDWVSQTDLLDTFIMFTANAMIGGLIGFLVGLLRKLANEPVDLEDNNEK